MKDYIKKFASTSAANNYIISDIPFVTSIATDPIQNLVCNEENKKISVDGQGNVNIVDTRSNLISFTIDNTTYYAESGMTWEEWVESKYNTGGFYISLVKGWDAITDGNDNYIVYNNAMNN